MLVEDGGLNHFRVVCQSQIVVRCEQEDLATGHFNDRADTGMERSEVPVQVSRSQFAESLFKHVSRLVLKGETWFAL